jgi:carbon monoxide dehydrogenase subunit G
MQGVEYCVREDSARKTTEYIFKVAEMQQVAIINQVMEYMINKTVKLLVDKLIEDCKLNVFAKINLDNLAKDVASEMAKRIADSILENTVTKDGDK